MISSVKGLLLPLLVFDLLALVLEYLFLERHSCTIVVDGEEYFFFVEANWFIAAMFISRLLYYVAKRITHNHMYLCLYAVCLLTIGVVLNNIHTEAVNPSHYQNWFHYRNAMCLTFFLWMGDFVKDWHYRRKPLMFCMTVLYVVCIALSRSGFLPVPIVYTDSVEMTLSQIPLFLFFSITGSVGIVCLAKYASTPLLERIGRNSLIIYISHFFTMQMVTNFLLKIIPNEGKIAGIVMLIVIISLTVLIDLVIAWLMNRYPLRYLIGKF